MKNKQPIGLTTKHVKLVWAAAACLLIGNGAAEAAVVMTLSESAGNVTLVASGTLNTTALSFDTQSDSSGFVWPSSGSLTTGGSVGAQVRAFTAILGPSSFGFSSNPVVATSGSGDVFGFYGNTLPLRLAVPRLYVSGAPLSGTSTWSGQTFASLGVTPGSYVYSWGAGANADTLTLNIGAAVPEPSSALLGLVGALSLLRRRRR